MEREEEEVVCLEREGDNFHNYVSIQETRIPLERRNVKHQTLSLHTCAFSDENVQCAFVDIQRDLNDFNFFL